MHPLKNAFKVITGTETALQINLIKKNKITLVASSVTDSRDRNYGY